MTALWSCPEWQLPLQNYGKPTYVQPTAQGQLLGSIGKGRHGGKGVEGACCYWAVTRVPDSLDGNGPSTKLCPPS